jgi:membrane fusion protein (multidrug efflux system)
MACSTHTENPVSAPPLKTEKIIHVHKTSIDNTIRLPGELKAFQEVDLYAKINSFVKEVLVDRGSVVKQGQELVRLDAPELDAQFIESREKLKSRESVFHSSQSYYKRLLQTSKTPGTVSLNDLEQAESKMAGDSSDVSSAKAAFQSFSELKNYLIVKAPFDGIISERNIHPGAFVGGSGKNDVPMLKLKEEGKLRLVIAVPEVYVGSLSETQPVKFQVRAFPSDTFTCMIKRVSRNLDLKTRSELVEMDIENKDHRLLPGMYAEVELGIGRSQPAYVVPQGAVFTNTEGVFVIRKKNGLAEWVPVHKGNSRDGQVEVFGALTEQDEILEHGTDQIRTGQALH